MGKIDLESFAEAYVGVALELVAGSRLGLDIDSFDKAIRARVSDTFGISKTDVVHLHNPFHWTFFCNANGSPFEYFQTGKQGESAIVRLKKDISSEDKSKMVGHVLSNYGKYLSYRLENPPSTHLQ